MGKFSSSSEQYMQRHQVGATSKKPTTKNKKKPLKITYISSPTMFRATNASEFRSVVQELTGKDSKVLDSWDDINNNGGEASQVRSESETPTSKVDSERSVDDIFSSYTSSQEIDDSFFWRNVSESMFEYSSPHVFL